MTETKKSEMNDNDSKNRKNMRSVSLPIKPCFQLIFNFLLQFLLKLKMSYRLNHHCRKHLLCMILLPNL